MAWGFIQDMKGRCIGFLLLCNKQPQTQRLQTVHINYLTVSMGQDGAQLCLVLSSVGANDADRGCDPIWGLMRGKSASRFIQMAGRVHFLDSRAESPSFPHAGGWKLPSTPRGPCSFQRLPTSAAFSTAVCNMVMAFLRPAGESLSLSLAKTESYIT